MRTVIQQHPIAIGLAALAVVLVAVIAVEAGLAGGLWSAPPPSAPRTAAVAETKLVPPLAAVNPEQAFPETATRPLFVPTRRPAPPAPTVANTMVKGQFTLQGVIAVGDQRIALLREKSNGRVHRVERGREVNGMTLTLVEGDKVTLAQGGDQELLTLQVQRGAGGPAAPAPVAAAAGPFAPPPAPPANVPPVPAQPQPGVPTPAAPAGVPTPNPNPNPATRSGFGPSLTPSPPPPTAAQPAQPMTPEELLARRRARRAQQPNQ